MCDAYGDTMRRQGEKIEQKKSCTLFKIPKSLLAWRVPPLWSASVLFLVVAAVPLALFTLSFFAGPGAADYGMSLPGGYCLDRYSSQHRSISGPKRQVSGGLTTRWVDEDVNRIGWDDRYIVCHQRQVMPSSPRGVAPAIGWWIIDMDSQKRLRSI